MSWDEGVADHYDEWSAGMTEDVPFCVELAPEADGPIVVLPVGRPGGRRRALYGDFDRSPFGDESREYVWVTRRPA